MSQQIVNDPTNVMGRRVVAYIVDAVLGAVLVGVVFFSSATLVETVPEGFCDLVNESQDVSSCIQLGDDAYVLEGNDNVPIGLVGIGYGLLVFVVLTATTGASIGKHVTGLRVVDAQGQRCSFGRALGRWLMMIVDSICMLGFFVAAFTHPHRRLGDMAAGTYVVAKGSTGRPMNAADEPPAGYTGAPGTWQPPVGEGAGQPGGTWQPPAG